MSNLKRSLAAVGFVVLVAAPARAQVHFDVAHSFAVPGAVRPNTSLVLGTDGNFYGTTPDGGAGNVGTIFRVTPLGAMTTLHSFALGITDGFLPQAGLIQAGDGNFYGTTYAGGSAGVGTVYKMTPAGVVTILHSFALGTEGGYPRSGLVQASDGHLYGMTGDGASRGWGSVFRVTLGGTFTVLHAFAGGADGGVPGGALVPAADGMLWGMATDGGASGDGAIFKISTTGVYTVVYSFVGARDGYPQGGFVLGGDGAMYGIAYLGGPIGAGTLFKITTAGAFTKLHDFAVPDGLGPNAPLIRGTDGNFYGTASAGGAMGQGSVFQVTPAGIVTAVHSFTGAEGAIPKAGVIQGIDGSLYGTTTAGGPSSAGVVFKVTTDGTCTPLAFFTGGSDGANASAELIAGSNGNLYGTTIAGGASDQGMVFTMTKGGVVTVLYSFRNQGDGAQPITALVEATDGNFYGTTYGGVYKVEADGAFSVVHNLSGAEGRYPSTLIQGTDGNFYFTTRLLGPGTQGTVLKMTPAGTVTVLHAFAGGVTDGSQPLAALVQAADGNFYGTTTAGGTDDDGTLFRITPGGVFTLLHSFQQNPDGGDPRSALVQAADGNLYGVAYIGGADGYGTIFKTTMDGTFERMSAFRTTQDGGLPQRLIQTPGGTFLGTTAIGGAHNAGTIFKWTPRSGVVTLHHFNTTDGSSQLGGLVQTGGGHFYGSTYFGGTNNMGVVFHLKLTVAGDFDGDTKADITVFRPSTGGWYTLQSSTNSTTSVSHSWGVSTDVPVPGDYDGDGIIDPAVYRPTTGLWAILKSSTAYGSSMNIFLGGAGGDVPVPADYDGDGRTDPAFFQRSTGYWRILRSSTNYTFATSLSLPWGLSTDLPLPGDYDGDGKADPAIFRASTGLWAILKSSTNYSTSAMVSWGLSTDVAVPGDYDGDGKIDPAVYRPSTGGWYILKSSTNYTTSSSVSWGLASDKPVPADYDGDGRTDPAIFRPSTQQWAILLSSTNYLSSSVYSWGLSTDTPLYRRP